MCSLTGFCMPCVQMLWATGSKPESLMETESETKRPGCQIPLISYRERERERERERNKGMGRSSSEFRMDCSVCVCVCVGTCECVSDSMVHL